ncbi:MAG: hypothetical protein ACRCXZ_08890 [Patescibacteria group bacterium]
MNNLSVSERILLQHSRINYHELKDCPIHGLFQNLIDNAPQLKNGDYAGLIDLIRSWYESGVFVYSMLDILLEPHTQITFDKYTGLEIKNFRNATNLKYTTGVCFSLAIKLKSLIDIVAPWAYATCIENTNWAGGSSNHWYVALSPSGFFDQDEVFIETNCLFEDVTRYDSIKTVVYNSHELLVADVCKGVFGRMSNHPDHLSFNKWRFNCNYYHGNWSGKIGFSDYQNSHRYLYFHSFKGDFAQGIALGLGTVTDICNVDYPVWVLGNKSYKFDDQDFLDRIHDLDPMVAEKMRIITNRGWTKRI